MRIALLFIVIATAALLVLGYIGGTDEGEVTATVVSAQTAQTWKSNSPESRIRARLADGSEIYATSPHTPPPAPNDKVVFSVRKTLLGWRSYTWQPRKPPTP